MNTNKVEIHAVANGYIVKGWNRTGTGHLRETATHVAVDLADALTIAGKLIPDLANPCCCPEHGEKGPWVNPNYTGVGMGVLSEGQG